MLRRLLAGIQPNEIELDVLEREHARVELGRNRIATVRDVGDRAPLPLEMREASYAFIAAGFVERIRRAPRAVKSPPPAAPRRSRPMCARCPIARSRVPSPCRRAPQRIVRRPARENARTTTSGSRRSRISFRSDSAARTRSAKVPDTPKVPDEKFDRTAAARGDDRPFGPSARVVARASPCAGRDRMTARTYVKRVVGNVDQVAVARLAEDVAPIVAVGPQLRVLEREIDAPQHRDAEEVAIADDRRDDDYAVHEQVRRELLPEILDRRRFPARSRGGASRRSSVHSRRTCLPFATTRTELDGRETIIGALSGGTGVGARSICGMRPVSSAATTALADGICSPDPSRAGS